MIDNVILGADITPDWGNAVVDFLNDMLWTTYTPTVTGFTLGNGTSTHRWMKVGDLIFTKHRLVLGSTSAVTGWINIALPFALGAAPNGFQVSSSAVDSSAGQNYIMQGLTNGNTIGPVWGNPAVVVFQSATAPFTWAQNDTLDMACRYSV